MWHKIYIPGDVYEYTPTSSARSLGDEPGLIEIVSDEGESFWCDVLSGIGNLVEKRGSRLRVDKESLFTKGLALKQFEPCIVDCGLTFDDIFDGAKA